MAMIPLASQRLGELNPLTWAAICLGAMALPSVFQFLRLWLIAPLKQWRKPMLSTQPQWDVTEADQLTSEMTAFLAPLLPQFRAEGFEVVSNIRLRGSTPGVTSYQLLLMNRRRSEMATILLTQADLLRNHVYAFKTLFEDGFEVQTGVNREIGCYPKNPRIDSIAVPWASDIAGLLEFHRRRVRKLGRERARAIMPAPGEELTLLSDEWQRLVSWLRGRGYCYPDPARNVYRRTLKGAFLTVWRMIPSIRRRRIRRRDRRSMQVWRELQMDTWIVPQSQNPADTDDAQMLSASDFLEESSDALKYEQALDEGEICHEIVSDGVIIRMGKQTRRSYLAASWLALFFLAFYIFLIVQFALLGWWFHRLAPYLGWQRSFSGRTLSWLALVVFFFVIQVITLLWGLGRTGGTAVLIASKLHLRFSNVPARQRDGQIAREDLRGLYVVKMIGSGFRRYYRLVALHRDGKQILLNGGDSSALLEVRSTLARALGIALDAAEPTPSRRPGHRAEMSAQQPRILR